ncbi:hypothetical protein KJ969_03325 [Patescibacteria group bacterium]|nr:hypothetical protein [Patescibacteria group bacterium]MBU1922456.1 hypothetical protein [Patescibacteria group bacterium]
MKKIFLSLLVAVCAFTIVGAGMALAQEPQTAQNWFKQGMNWHKQKPNLPDKADKPDRAQMHEQMLEKKAQTLGMSLEDLKAKLDQGMTFKQILEERGIDPEQFREQTQANQLENMKQHLAELVGQGKITQEQADKRLEQMQEHLNNAPNKDLPDKPRRGGWGKLLPAQDA